MTTPPLRGCGRGTPDGPRIVWAYNEICGEDRSGTELYVMDADGNHQTRLTNNAFADFSRDGRLRATKSFSVAIDRALVRCGSRASISLTTQRCWPR
jgi:hypothetical protein